MRLKSAIIAIAIATSSVAAYAQNATKQSVSKLLEVAQVRQQMETMFSVMEKQMSGQFAKKLRSSMGSETSDEQMQKVKQIEKNIIRVVREEMAWDRIEPTYIKIYQDNFTQKEVDGLITFYSSPVGQSTLKKMPQVMQSAVQTTQRDIMPRVIKRLDEVMRPLRNKKSSTAAE